MVQLAEWAVENSLAVVALVPVIWCLSRICSWPAVRHTLWLVLLIKFVTPPIVTVPADWLALDRVRPQHQFAGASARQSPGEISASPVFPPAESFLDRFPPPVESSVSQPLDKTVIHNAPVIAAIRPSPEKQEPAAGTTLSQPGWQTALRTVLGFWLIGSTVLFSIQFFRLVRFGWRLSKLSTPSEQLQAETAAAAARLGLARYAQPRLVDGVVSPMLWGVGRWSRVLFPAELFEQLDADARGTLLMHELAHYRRGDHWVRVLEFAVSALYWWHPVVWWTLREIESAEEDCCDSWVMQRSASSPRCYATALLDTIDFLCERHPIAPPIASGLGNPTDLRGRLVRIMTGTAQATLSPAGRALTWSLIVLLPMQPAAFGNLSRALSLSDLLRMRSNEADTANRASAPPIESPAAPLASAAFTPAAAPLLDKGLTPSSLPSPGAGEWARAVSPDGRFHLVARTGGRMELHDVRRSRVNDLSEWKIASAAFVPGTQTFVTGGFDRQVRLWDASAARPFRTLGEHPDQVVTVAVSNDGTTLASGSRNGTVSRWSLGTEAARIDIELAAPVSCVRFSPDGSAVAVATGSWRSASSGGVVTLDLATWTVFQRTALPAPIGALAFVEGRAVAAGAWDGTVHYLDAESHQPLLSVVSSKDAISAAGFSGDTGVFPPLSLEAARAQIAAEQQQRLQEQQAQLDLLQQIEFVTPSATQAAAR